MAEIDGMSAELEQTTESWNSANIELDVVARRSLVVAQQRIEQRVRDLDVNDEGDSALEMILGSSTLDDITACA